MYSSTERTERRAPWTVPMLRDAKHDGRRLVMLTCYDAGFARVADAAGIDLLLVGDSLGMVVQGEDSTLPVTVDAEVGLTETGARVAGSVPVTFADFGVQAPDLGFVSVEEAGEVEFLLDLVQNP